jgi:effector-binding domain-containing protein
MRQRLQYSRSEIQRAQFTRGKEWMMEDGTEYIGLYHTYVTGEVYTEADWNPQISKPLVPYEDVTSDKYSYKKITRVDTKYNAIQSIRRTVTEQEVQLGVMTRYFLKPVNSGNIIEISNDQYTQFLQKKIDPNYYIGVSLQWYITGPVNDTTQNGILVEGIATKNLNSIRAANMPGLEEYLSDLLEYATDNQYQIPRDIN